MKIKFLSGPRTGQIDHAPNSQEIQLLAKAGIIEIIPYSSYRERLAAEHSSARGHGSTDPNVVGVEWGLKDRAQSPLSKVLIIKRVGAQTFYLESPDTDTPPSIVARWAELTKAENPELVRERLEQLKSKQITQQSDERKSVFAQIFSGK